MKTHLLYGLVLGPVAALTVVVGAWLALPWPVLHRWIEPDRTSLMRYRIQRAASRGEELDLRRTPVPLEQISPSMVRAVVLAEDGRFREHGGIDWRALAEELRYDGSIPPDPSDPADRAALREALRYGWEHRSELRGRSTITQQLAKNLYYTPERSLGRKLGEFFVARRLEWFLDKDRILELYLNSVELGPGLFGVEAAAREYFGVPASDLTPRQAASLAATLPHPLTSNPDHRPGRMAWRRDRILQRMRGGGSAELPPIPAAPPEIDLPDAPVLDPELEPGSATEEVDSVLDPTSGPEGAGPDTAAPPARPDTGGAVADPDRTSPAGVGPPYAAPGESATRRPEARSLRSRTPPNRHRE